MPWLLNPGLIVDPVISGFYDAVKVGAETGFPGTTWEPEKN
jgi:hypothetical protein